MANITFEQYNNVSFHDGVVDIVRQFLKTTQNVMYNTTIQTTYQNRYMHVNEEGYFVSIRN